MVPSWIRFLAGIKNCYPPHMSHEGRRKEHIATRTSIYSQIHKFLLAQCRIMLNRLELIELNKLPITKCKKNNSNNICTSCFPTNNMKQLGPKLNFLRVPLRCTARLRRNHSGFIGICFTNARLTTAHEVLASKDLRLICWGRGFRHNCKDLVAGFHVVSICVMIKLHGTVLMWYSHPSHSDNYDDGLMTIPPK